MKKCNRQPAATLHGVCREILWAGSNSSQKDGKGLSVLCFLDKATERGVDGSGVHSESLLIIGRESKNKSQ